MIEDALYVTGTGSGGGERNQYVIASTGLTVCVGAAFLWFAATNNRERAMVPIFASWGMVASRFRDPSCRMRRRTRRSRGLHAGTKARWG